MLKGILATATLGLLVGLFIGASAPAEAQCDVCDCAEYPSWIYDPECESGMRVVQRYHQDDCPPQVCIILLGDCIDNW